MKATVTIKSEDYEVTLSTVESEYPVGGIELRVNSSVSGLEKVKVNLRFSELERALKTIQASYGDPQ